MQNKLNALCITGGMGVGKSTVLNYFSHLGFTIYNVDELVLKLFNVNYPYYKEIASAFDSWLNTNFVNSNGIDKVLLRPYLEKFPNGFSHSVTIVSPFIQKEIFQLVNSSTSQHIIVEMPLLIEMGMQDSFKDVLLLTCDMEKRIKRIQERPPYHTIEKIRQILNNQTSDDARRSFCSYEIDNSGTKEELIAKLNTFKEIYYG